MSFTYKLARRLAQVHVAFLTLLVVSCMDSASDPSSAAPGTSADPTVPPQSVGTQSALYPNEPAGFTRFAELDGSVLPHGMLNSGENLGHWTQTPLPDKDLTLANLVGSPTPQSAPQEFATRFPAGLVAGHGPVYMGGWDLNYAPKTKVYSSVWIRIRGTSFENQATGTKLGFISYGDPVSGTANQGFLLLTSAPHQGVYTKFGLRFVQQFVVSRKLDQNVNKSKLMTAGPWHHIETVHELNTLNQANGKLQIWIDGVQIMNYSNVKYIIPGRTSKFNYYKWNPTWGGLNGVRTRDDYIDIDHIYISGQ